MNCRVMKGENLLLKMNLLKKAINCDIGFRVERIKTKNGIKLIFLGDKQIDLDTFLVQCCQNDFKIW